MVQIVHDLAPGSPHRLRLGVQQRGDFANDDPQTSQTAGAKVIVDDVSYFDRALYQDGVIAKAVNDVTAAGATYFSSAGNNNFNVGGVPVSSYEAQNGYRPTACPATIPAGHVDCHDFDPGAGVSDGDTVTWSANTTLRFVMGWNQPAFGIVTDYDLYMLNGAGAIALSARTTTSSARPPSSSGRPQPAPPGSPARSWSPAKPPRGHEPAPSSSCSSATAHRGSRLCSSAA